MAHTRHLGGLALGDNPDTKTPTAGPHLYISLSTPVHLLPQHPVLAVCHHRVVRGEVKCEQPERGARGTHTTVNSKVIRMGGSDEYT